MTINLKAIEEKIKPLGGRSSYDNEFIYELLTVFGRASANITRLRNGQLNIANDKTTEVAQKNVVYFKLTSANLYSAIDDLKTDPTVVRYSTRFVIVTDYEKLLAIDTKTNETLDINIRDIDKHYAFFLPWSGLEKAQFVGENHADVKAAEKMAKLFDAIIESNHGGDADYYHGLNVFFTRLLFCYFAEDTGIFGKSQFTNAIASYTQEDGSDLSHFLTELFTALDIQDRTGYSSHIAAFPYVNGQLFRDSRIIPEFNRKARKLLIECGSKLDWSSINPDIFGSMIQAVVNPGQRAGLGMHYTSVPNIMKTIEPLFLDDLKNEINENWDNEKELEKILSRISKIKIFDPACGSGNFLIIAYKELRKLEHIILERQGELGTTNATLLGSSIHIDNFYGIEIDDFAHEVAILSLWLAKHQMNQEFSDKFGIDIPLIPLKESGNIKLGNATRIDWNEVCPNNGSDEIYILGNPPYLGQRNQEQPHRDDLAFVFGTGTLHKKLDYVSCWFMLAAKYMMQNVQVSFISTSSINQGIQVEQLWPKIFKLAEIGFAYKPFKWSNNAKNSAGVICVVIGLRKISSRKKFLFDGQLRQEVQNINAYLANGKNIIVQKTKSSISHLPRMVSGCQPREGGYLMLTNEEKNKLISQDPRIEKFILPMVGSEEYIKGTNRYCIWIEESSLEEAYSIPLLKDRIEKVRAKRTHGNSVERTFANVPYRFVTNNRPKTSQIIIPGVSTDNRTYIPMGVLGRNIIVNSRAFCIYDGELWILGVLMSMMHTVWVKAVAGRLGSAINYSSHICYNTFPLPELSIKDKQLIEKQTLDVLDARENHSQKSLAEMYDPDNMPADLLLAHNNLDNAVEHIYRSKIFDNDEDRLAYLFDMYEKITDNERKYKKI